ncbi:hypothetical protein F5I97DRAFT_33183 [Phlebopus sp. FC_14]|nr:hypothetical protein F5I97DRAFT_33183 [Phlebopus sp. FC_14]
MGSFLTFACTDREFGSDYNRAYAMSRVICYSGPTTNSLSAFCASRIAVIAKGFSLFTTAPSGSVRPDVKLAQTLSSEHSTQVMGFMKDFVASVGCTFPPIQGEGPPAKRQKIAHDVIVFGALEWFAKNRYYVLDSFCRPRNIPLIEVGDTTRAAE